MIKVEQKIFYIMSYKKKIDRRSLAVPFIYDDANFLLCIDNLSELLLHG